MTATARQSTCVAIDGRALLIEGPPGSGKSSLALALIDRGAILVGDDSVLLETAGGVLTARPHPNTRGMLEVRNLGLLTFACIDAAAVALMVTLDAAAPRYIERAEAAEVAGTSLPMVRLCADAATLAIKAELALRHYGLPG